MITIKFGALGKKTEGTGNERKNQDHSDHSSVEIDWKSLRGLRRLADTKAPVQDSQGVI